MVKMVDAGYHANSSFESWFKEKYKRPFNSEIESERDLRESFVAGWNEGFDLCARKSDDPYPD